MSKIRARDARRPLGWVMLGGGGLVVTFWILYLGGVMDLGQQDPLVSEFEAAFVLADTVLGLALLSAGALLLRRDPPGLYVMVIAASMALYLGLLDLAFYARQGLYDVLSAASLFELGLNLICIVGGAICLRVGARLWRMELLRAACAGHRRAGQRCSPLRAARGVPETPEPPRARAAGGDR